MKFSFCSGYTYWTSLPRDGVKDSSLVPEIFFITFLFYYYFVQVFVLKYKNQARLTMKNIKIKIQAGLIIQQKQQQFRQCLFFEQFSLYSPLRSLPTQCQFKMSFSSLCWWEMQYSILKCFQQTALPHPLHILYLFFSRQQRLLQRLRLHQK